MDEPQLIHHKLTLLLEPLRFQPLTVSRTTKRQLAILPQPSVNCQQQIAKIYTDFINKSA
jgi:hypothetical protein